MSDTPMSDREQFFADPDGYIEIELGRRQMPGWPKDLAEVRRRIGLAKQDPMLGSYLWSAHLSAEYLTQKERDDAFALALKRIVRYLACADPDSLLAKVIALAAQSAEMARENLKAEAEDWRRRLIATGLTAAELEPLFIAAENAEESP